MDETGSYQTLLFDVDDDGVATLVLNRPDRYNALNAVMARELQDAWTRVREDPQIVCAIVTGAGEKAFCTGVDVADVATLLGGDPEGVVVSPGPGEPKDAGVSVEMVRECAARGLPLLGVCLGHQAIGIAFGGRIARARSIKMSRRSGSTFR